MEDAGSNPVTGANLEKKMNGQVDILNDARLYALDNIRDLADELCLFQDGCLKGPFMRNLEHKLHKLCNGVNQQQLAISIIQRICIEIVSQHGE